MWVTGRKRFLEPLGTIVKILFYLFLSFFLLRLISNGHFMQPSVKYHLQWRSITILFFSIALFPLDLCH